VGIKLENISKSFGEKIVIRDFSIELPDSGVIAMMGPSGCGKTTLFRILAGLDKPDSGRIISSNHKRLSAVFQEDRMLGGVTALGNLIAVIGRDRLDIAKSWLEYMGLADSAHLLPREMSGGMRRRLAIARAMAYGGDLLLLDEPFAGLDADTRENIYPYIFSKNKSCLTIMITHDLDEARKLADQVVIMDGIPLSIRG